MKEYSAVKSCCICSKIITSYLNSDKDVNEIIEDKNWMCLSCKMAGFKSDGIYDSKLPQKPTVTIPTELLFKLLTKYLDK